MVKYKLDIMQRLKEAGYSSTTLRREKIFGESVMQAFRSGEIFPNKSLDRLCELLQCQPGDILEYVPDETSESDNTAPAAEEEEVV